MSSPLDDNESSPGAVHDGQPPPPAAFTVDDIDSLQPGRCVSTAVIEEFFRSQFEECLRQEMLGGNLESCLVFGPDTFADLRRLMLPDGEPADGQQSFPALERFCREHDMASKQYLLLPLLTPGHGSLLVLCKPVQRQAQVEAPGTKDTELESVLRQMGVHQPWLLLHFDSLSGHGSLKGNAPDCAALLRFLKPYVGQEFEAEVQALKLHTAHVPQQGQPGLGSTFMCTNALYFVANLPPIIQGHFVEKMKDYKEKPKDLFENLSHRGFPWYPGFLSTEWYPRNVPEALRKLLLSGVMARLQAHTNSPETAAVLARASEVQNILHSASARQFEMPAQRLKKQLEMKRARQLAAGRRHWASGWTAVTLSGIVTCSLGTWSIQLRGNLRTTVLQFEDVLFDGQLPPRPAEFDYCFGVRLKPGQQPPPFVVHIPPHLLPQTAQRAAAAAGQAERQVEMRFAAEPVTAGNCTLWSFEKSCWDEICSHLSTAVDGCRKLSLVQRPGTGGKAGLVHVDLELELAPQPAPPNLKVLLRLNTKQLQQAARPLPASRLRQPQRTAGTGTTPDAAQQPGSPGSPGGSAAMPDAGGSLKAPDSPQHTAGTTGTADPADMAAASFLAALPLWGAARSPAHAAAASGLAMQTTEKGAKRLLTGKDGGGDRRARLTVRGQKYYAGYFPTGAAAAQAEDLMVIWVHYSSLGWPDRWMQGCSTLDNKLNFPASFHLATHEQLVASLGSCPDKDALRRLLQKHLNAGGQQPSELAESSRQAASQGGPSASPRSEQQAVAAAAAAEEQPAAPGAGTKRPAPVESAAAGSSLGAKRQRGAAAGERQVHTRSLRSNSAAQDAEQQQGQQQGAPTEPQGAEDALEQSSRQQAQQQPQAEQTQAEQHEQQKVQQEAQQRQPREQLQQQQEAQPQAMEVDAAAPPPQQMLGLPLPPPLQPQQAQQQPVAEPKREEQVLPQVHGLATGSPLLLQPGGGQAVAASAGQQAQPPLEAVSAAGAGTGQHPLLPASSAVAALRTMLQGSGGDGDGWPADVRQQAADALAATSAAATETELIAAQIDAIHAALKPLEVPFSARLACTRRFRQLPAVQRSGLLAELRNIVREGSVSDLLDWMQEVAAS